MPAHNEEEAIAHTVHEVIDTLTTWMKDFEVIVVDDGSRDRTGVILDTIAEAHTCLRVIHHPVNRGYGAALVSGFEGVFNWAPADNEAAAWAAAGKRFTLIVK